MSERESYLKINWDNDEHVVDMWLVIAGKDVREEGPGMLLIYGYRFFIILRMFWGLIWIQLGI